MVDSPGFTNTDITSAAVVWSCVMQAQQTSSCTEYSCRSARQSNTINWKSCLHTRETLQHWCAHTPAVVAGRTSQVKWLLHRDHHYSY